MTAQSYVLVSTDPADLIIKNGPLLWDGATRFDLPVGVKALLTSDATTAGYTFPAPPAVATNTATLQAQASNAIAANVTYLAIGAPTNAQVVTQVNRLTRECTALIRLLLNQVDDTSGT